MLVSVVVPMFEAAGTIARTLRSAQAQTHAELEIIVVDDGSTDDGTAIVAAAAARDPRIALIRGANGGVAAARNRAIAMARGAFIAPLDADDLWDPRKIELQLARFAATGDDTVLVYNWFVPIDGADRVSGAAAMPVVEGTAFHRHLDWNFISNGSTPLVRADALRAFGYDPALRAADAQGCEDYLMQLLLARRGSFACVPAFLTGYRKVAGSMAGNVARMIRSHMLVLDRVTAGEGVAVRRIAATRLAEFGVELARHHVRRGRVVPAARALAVAFARDPRAAAAHVRRQWTLMRARGATAAAPPGAAFPLADPFAPIGFPLPPARLRRLRPLEVLDAQSSASSRASAASVADGVQVEGGSPA
ncbi:hypothetical protein ASG29_04105 [Sphingomonas sp. Leaf412]|uniref:glycosyltransferase family 2 protein n=1 Tax=Sphingomonas sp. Leaf412 TaxID=1736370 RepID=UPI0006FFD9DC|nr:glycosyltransferase family 2 protein [Sphingomonas sp. Leaf412]KQT35289.1 hypothetical protein ASG29_04105 [Sphingomonas sp. Leaf412]